MSWSALILAISCIAPVIAVRLLFLVPGRLGWIFYLGNTFSEFFVKKVRWSRTAVEIAMAVVGMVLLRVSGLGWPWVSVVGCGLVLLELYVSKVERRLLCTSYTPLDSIGLRNASPETTRGLASGYPTPSTHPELTLNFIGPFVERLPRYQLGTLLVGRRFELRLIICNHTIVPTQTPLRLRVEVPGALGFEGEREQSLARLVPGHCHEVTQQWSVLAESRAGVIRVSVDWGDAQKVFELHFEAAIAGRGARVANASITRYPGACRSAFAWRGDMDLYDESTLQSIEGLEAAFGLAARYRMPQTMYLSTRLSLDPVIASQWGEHYGVDRGAGRIPDFIEWMRTNIDLRHDCGYPFKSSKRFVIELGNHGHLHFGTDTAGAVENNWKPKARMGAGVYPWLGPDRSSFGEQRDNALEARRLCERLFDYTPKSWAMPNRTNDASTAAAMEAAGCEVLSDSNVRTQHNVLLQPPPHHPGGTSAVELTKRYPGDPQHIYHVGMNLFWIHRAHRMGIPVVFMCHQHLRQFDGYACTRFTEYILRYVVSRFSGDLHVNTVFGIGKYFREVISPQTRRVKLVVDGDLIHIKNESDIPLSDVPVDIVFVDGRRSTVLVNMSPRTEASIHLVEP